MLASDGGRSVRRAHEGGGLKTPEERHDRPGTAPRLRIPHAPRCTAMIAAVATVASLGACSSESGSDYAQIADFARKSWTASGQAITLQQAAAVPYASIGVRIDDGPQQMLVMAAESGGASLWTSASHIVLSIRDGRIVQTVGLDRDLGGLTPMGTGSIEPPRVSLNGQVHQILVADFGDLGVYATPIACTAKKAADEPIDILGRKIDTVRIEERCEDANLGWAFENTYWLDAATGQVWRSIQHVHPDAGTVEVNVLRPPSG